MNNHGLRQPVSDRKLVLYSILITLIVFGTFMRINQVFIVHPLDDLDWDMGYHYQRAFDIKGQQDIEALLHPPGFQIFLSCLMRTVGPNRFFISLAMAILSVTTPWLWYRWLREVTRDKTISLIGYTIFTYLPGHFQIFSYFMDSILLLPLSAAGLWLTWRAARKTTWRACLTAAVVCGAACLTKMIVIPYVVLPWLYVAYKISRRLSKLQGLKMVATSLAVIACIWGLAPLRIWTHTGAIVLAPDTKYLQRCFESGAKEVQVTHYYNRTDGTTWVEASVWSCSSMGCQPFYPFSHWHTDRQGRVCIDIDYRKGWDHAEPIRVDFMDRLRYTFENVIYFFFQPHWPEDFIDMVAPFPGWLWPMSRFIWLPLTVVTAAAILWRHRREFAGWYFIAITLISTLQQVGITEGRYMKVWQGIAVVTFLYVVARSKRYQLWNDKCLTAVIEEAQPTCEPQEDLNAAVDDGRHQAEQEPAGPRGLRLKE